MTDPAINNGQVEGGTHGTVSRDDVTIKFGELSQYFGSRPTRRPVNPLAITVTGDPNDASSATWNVYLSKDIPSSTSKDMLLVTRASGSNTGREGWQEKM